MNVIERRSKTKDILINFLMGLLKIYSVIVLSQKKSHKKNVKNF